MTARTWPIFCLLVACSPYRIPEHLQLAPEEKTERVPVDDLDSALGAIVGRDPLARSPELIDADLAQSLTGGEPVADWIHAVAQVERGDAKPEVVLQQLEDRWRGTPAVALSRGYRLRLAQERLAGPSDEAAEAEALLLVTPLRRPATEGPLPLGPFAWLVPTEPRGAVLAYGDRWALTAWLDGPNIPLGAVAQALSGEAFDSLRDTPEGRIVSARASNAQGSPDAGLADLRLATRLELMQVGADRDAEQRAWMDTRKKVAAELGAEDPVAFLLQRAANTLTSAAGDDRGAGGALLAAAGARWIGKCAAEPCAGVDRTDALTTAGRFHTEIDSQSRLWRVIALKSAMDAMDVGHDGITYRRSVLDLADALLGTGAGPLDTTLLRKDKPDAGTWLALGRATGVDGSLDWASARVGIGAHLAREVSRAAETNTDPEVRAVLERIGRRATD